MQATLVNRIKFWTITCDVITKKTYIGVMGKQKFSIYAVARGRKVGLFPNWNECKLQINGFNGARFKGFNSKEDAERFVQKNSGETNNTTTNSTSTSSNIDEKATIPLFQYTKERKLDNIRKRGPTCAQGTQKDVLERNSPDYSRLDCKRFKSTISSSDSQTTAVTKPTYSKYSVAYDKNIRKSNEKGFSVDDEGFYEVYTDGACTKNGQKGARAGIGVFWSNVGGTPANLLNVSEPVKGDRATNNVGEIQAITRCIDQAKEQNISKLRVLSDSKFAIQCVEDWMPKWKKNGWKTTTGDVKNRIDLEHLDEALQKAAKCNMIVAFKHVRGHLGIDGNEAADRLAVAGARQFSSNSACQ